jgi:double-stranded uracil-DNA glycosylase
VDIQEVDLIDYQERVNWMGSTVLTLAELWPQREVRAMIVGLNPAPTSVDLGHYYQGKVGQAQLKRLARAGMFDLPADSTYFEEAALAGGVGFADLVRRPTRGEGGVSPAELQFGRSLLVQELSKHEVPLVICVFRHPVVALLGSEGVPGFQVPRTSWGAEVFRMPGPFEPRENSARVLQTLSDRIAI